MIKFLHVPARFFIGICFSTCSLWGNDIPRVRYAHLLPYWRILSRAEIQLTPHTIGLYNRTDVDFTFQSDLFDEIHSKFCSVTGILKQGESIHLPLGKKYRFVRCEFSATKKKAAAIIPFAGRSWTVECDQMSVMNLVPALGMLSSEMNILLDIDPSRTNPFESSYRHSYSYNRGRLLPLLTVSGMVSGQTFSLEEYLRQMKKRTLSRQARTV